MLHTDGEMEGQSANSSQTQHKSPMKYINFLHWQSLYNNVEGHLTPLQPRAKTLLQFKIHILLLNLPRPAFYENKKQ